MARTLPSTLIAAMNAASSDALVLALLEITHPSLTAIRLVNNTEAVVSDGDTFAAFPFSVILPPEGDGETPVIQCSVSNVSQEIVIAARTVAGSKTLATANLYIVEHADPDTILVSYPSFRVQNLTYTADVVTFDLTIEHFLNEPFPAGTFTPGKFPGIY